MEHLWLYAVLVAGIVVLADTVFTATSAVFQPITGFLLAREIGWPYWMSDTVSEDANDYARRCGVFSLAMGIKGVLTVRRRA